MDFPPQMAKQWYQSLSPDQKKHAEEQIEFIEDHLKNVICAGEEKDFTFFVKWLASKYKKPWIKQDTQIVIRGHKGIGKSEFITSLLTKIFGIKRCVRITDVTHLTGQFNADTAECLFLICEELVNNNSKQVDSFMKANFDTQTLKRINEKGIPVWWTHTFYQAIFITNAEWAQRVSSGDRRFLCIHCDADWIMIGCQKNNRNWQTHQYFQYLANLDPRVFAYYLAERVDITNFDVKAERYTNQETATQKMKSLHVENFHMAFWAKFIQNEVHNYGKCSDRTVTKKVDDWAQRVIERLNNRDTKVSMRDIMLNEINVLRDQVTASEKKPFWQFMVTKSDSKEILAHLNSVIDNPSANLMKK